MYIFADNNYIPNKNIDYDAIKRSDPMFEKVVLMSKRLTEEGFLMVSGGGLKKS